ncbi:hypothetical protein AX16_008790 [Volvariella volvacea WC 439]|nr:hypothetical protein AX16_008790 [Volvariella volvacea WC 439]
MSDEEYEVESIVQAKVVKKRKNLLWQFKVRWKGYSPEDDTWEPVESFEGSQDVLNKFWERTNSGGRDYRDISLFKAGEEFIPTGPPRRKQRQTLSNPSTTPVASATDAHQSPTSTSFPEKRRRSPSPNPEPNNRPIKRARERVPPSTSTSQSQGIQFKNYPPQSLPQNESPILLPKPRKTSKRPSSPEVVPDSDEETENTLTLQDPAPKNIARRSTKPATVPPPPGSMAAKMVKNLHRDRTYSKTSAAQPKISDEVEKEEDRAEAVIPSHKTRSTNPLVKKMDDPQITHTHSAISTKARIMNQTSTTAEQVIQSTRPKPGPGRSSTGMLQKNRSSLLTAEKGALKTVKGKFTRAKRSSDAEEDRGNNTTSDPLEKTGQHSAEDAQDNATLPSVVPGSELLNLAAGETNAEDAEMLPTFEDAEPEPPSLSTTLTTSAMLPPRTVPSSKKSMPFGSLPELSKTASQVEKAPNEKASALVQEMLFTGSSSSWGRTMFDDSNKPTSVLHLALDHSHSIPVKLEPLGSGADGAQKLGSIVQRNPNAPPGKFYSANNANTVLDTMRTCGTTALVKIDARATQDQVSLFQQFQDRLRAGRLFIAVAGPDVLAFCFSKSFAIASKLNIPTSHLEGDSTVVARVTIENFSGYAEAALSSESW